ncbi:MAG: T9SS type A sorting domain-containing protein [Prevotella sp.]|nr:T9SS type A sorting domain-containing protein [Prevotella sp.]
MKRYLSFAFALLCGLTMSAEGYSFLNVAKVTGESEGNALSDFTKITFTGGQMHLLNGASEVKTYDLSSLSKMWLSTTSGIRNIQTTETDRPAEIYLMSGKRVNAGLNNLPKGVYIIKEGNVARKLIRR